MIEKISLENFKGTTRVIHLGQLNIFRGTSGSGKSTWLEAVRVAVLGHDPGYGKLLAETMAFSSSDTMEVTVTNPDVSVKRVFSNRGGKASQKIFINGEGMTAKAAEPLMYEHFGQFPMMLNPDEFFDMSDDKKITFLFGLSDTETSSEALQRKCVLDILGKYTEAVDYIFEYEFKDHKSPMDLTQPMFSKLVMMAVDKIAEKDTPAGRALTKIFHEFLTAKLPNGQETLSMYASTLRTEINATRRAKQDAEAANRKLLEEKADKMKLVNYNEEENSTFIEAYRKEIADIEKELHAREKLKAARERLESGIEVHAASIKKNEEKLEALKGKLLSEEEMKESEAMMSDMNKNQDILFEKRQSARDRWEEATSKISSLSTTVSYCLTCQGELECPNCNAGKEEQIKKNKEEVEVLQGKVDELNTYIKNINDALEANTKDMEKLSVANSTHAQNMLDYGVAVKHQEELEGLLEKEKKNLDNIEEPGAGTETLQAQVEGLKKKLGERLVAEKNHQWLRTLSGTIAKSNETIYNSEALISALSVSENSVKTVRDELTSRATGAIEDACNTLLERVNPNFKLFYEIEGGKFEIQCVNVNDDTVPFKTLSGGEKVLYLSAQLLALMLIVDPKLKILEVEMGELSGNLVPPFMDALKTMTEGEDVQIVLSSCHGDFEVGDSAWTVHEMGE